MDASIFVLHDDKTLVRMNEQPYAAESLLQALLADHPDLLAGNQINPADPRRWLLVRREAGVPAADGGADWWAVDHLFLDQDAIPTFVEVKRAGDTRIRREVVAQMLDYAANATEYWPVDRMREQFARRCAETGTDPVAELGELIGGDGDEAAFWELARSNLREGRVRLLFVADRIPASLRRIVEFLNRQMSPAEVLAVEIRQFASSQNDSLRTLVPRVIGQTEQAMQSKPPIRTQDRPEAVSRDDFFARIEADKRPAVLNILSAVEAIGALRVDFRGSAARSWARIALDGVPGVPINLDHDFLWVSLGRHHPVLREPAVNRDLRAAILRVCPSCRQAGNPDKSEVGIPLRSIGPEGLDHLPHLFDVMKRGLSPTGAQAEL